MKKLSLLLLFFVFLFACISVNSIRLDETKTRPPLTPDQVKVYLSEKDVPGKYEKVALINAKGNYSVTNESKMINEMKKEAAKLGANGIIIEKIKDPKTLAKVANAFLGTGANRKGKVLAIYVLEEE